MSKSTCQRWLLYAHADVASARNRTRRCVGTREIIVAEGDLLTKRYSSCKRIFFEIRISRIVSTAESTLCAKPYNSVQSAAWGPTTTDVSQDVAKSLATRFCTYVRGASYLFRQGIGGRYCRRSTIRVLHVVKAVNLNQFSIAITHNCLIHTPL